MSRATSPGAAAVSGDAVHVSFQRGSDDAGDGSASAPFRTLTRGLAAAAEGGLERVLVGYGTYGEGESFPLELWNGLELRGIGAAGTRLQGNGGETLVRIAPAAVESSEPVHLAALGLTGGAVGIEAGVGHTPLFLNGVVLEAMPVGLRLTASAPGAGPVQASAEGLRAVECEVGLEALGVGPIELELAHSAFERCGVGLSLRAAEDVEPDAYGGPGVHHTVRVSDTVFQGGDIGAERRGAPRTNLGPPYRFERCLFLGNRIGLELQRPAADSPLEVLDSRFLSNANFGLRASGHRGDPRLRSRVEGCEFRWNGVGLHTTNTHVLYEVRRNRFLDNAGNAIFMANFMTDPVRVRIAGNLIADNGGAGVYCMADGQQLAAEVLYNTIANNGSGGIYRKTRHAGKSTFEVRGCIVVGNAPDLEKIEPFEVFHSLVGDGSAGTENGNLAGDPGFGDAGRRDFELRSGSPCRDRGELSEGLAERLGELDLRGRPRFAGPPDLGAFELQGAPR